MEIRRDVFQAIADPARRAILGLVALQICTVLLPDGGDLLVLAYIQCDIKNLDKVGYFKTNGMLSQSRPYGTMNVFFFWLPILCPYGTKEFDALNI